MISTRLGQASYRQVTLQAGCDIDTTSTLVNKVCASCNKAFMICAQQIHLGDRNIVLTGGMESMSKAPHMLYLSNPSGYVHVNAIDSITLYSL